MEVHFFYVFKKIPKTAWQTDITFSMQYLALVIHWVWLANMYSLLTNHVEYAVFGAAKMEILYEKPDNETVEA